MATAARPRQPVSVGSAFGAVGRRYDFPLGDPALVIFFDDHDELKMAAGPNKADDLADVLAVNTFDCGASGEVFDGYQGVCFSCYLLG